MVDCMINSHKVQIALVQTKERIMRLNPALIK